MTRGETALTGRIAFQVRIGVTGHRNTGVERTLDGVLERIRQLLPVSEATPVRLGVVSALAEGADRLVVEAVFDYAAARGEDARLEVILPLEEKRYAELQGFSGAVEEEFCDLLKRASSVTPLDKEGTARTLSAAYEAAGRHVVNRCDVLVALWDGRPTGGRGGTAETLLYAAENGKPCIWVPTDSQAPIRDNIADAGTFLAELRRRAAVGREGNCRTTFPRTRLMEPLEKIFREVDAFNRAFLRESEVRRRHQRELDAFDETSEWVAGPQTRAAMLADRYQRRFMAATWLMSGLAIGAAACLGASVALDHPSPAWAWAEVGCLLALGVLFAVVHRFRLHDRWLSHRLLAERLRSAYFLAPTRIDFRRTAGLETVFAPRQSADWVLRAFEEVWDSRPQMLRQRSQLTDEEASELRTVLADRWIGCQIHYHEQARRRHERRGHALTAIIVILFAGALVFAVLHAAHSVEAPATLLSVTLPVAAGAVGWILTTRQHRASVERYRRTQADLEAVQQALYDADPEAIGRTAAEAATVIAEELQDWFGAMWFLDVEHPP